MPRTSLVRSCVVILFGYLVLLLFVFFILLWLHVEDELERFLVHGNLRWQAGEVEIIFYEVFGNFGEVLMAEKGAELRYPRLGALGG